MKNTNTLTEGNITSSMLRFAIPYLLANLLQALYGAADTLIVGQFSDAAGLSAVSIGSQAMQFLTSIIIGLTMGGTILIGRYLGANQQKEIKETIGTMFTLFALLAAGFTLLFLLLAKPVVLSMKTPVEAVDQAVSYVYICTIGIIFIFGYNALSAVLRGLGDSKNPLIFVAVACVCNIFLDLLFVGGFRMGAAGAALATVLAQAISMLLAILLLKKGNFIFDFKRKSFKIYKNKLKSLLHIGLPIALQDSLVIFSFLIITAIVNDMGGVVASATIGVTNKVNSFTLLPPGAFSAAIAAMVAQNMGASKPDRAKKCTIVGIFISLIFGIASFVLLQIAPQFVMGMFTPDTMVIQAGAEFLKAFSIDCVLVCFVFCMNGFFNGCGHTSFTMLNTLLPSFLIRVPVAYLFSKLTGATLFEIGFAAPIASVASVVMGLVYFKMGRWKKPKI